MTAEDWKTIDILGQPKSARPYLNMICRELFLGELTLEGRPLELDGNGDLREIPDFENEVVTAVNLQERPKRDHKVGEFQKSPFRERMIDIDKPKLTKLEDDIWNWLNINNQNPM